MEAGLEQARGEEAGAAALVEAAPLAGPRGRTAGWGGNRASCWSMVAEGAAGAAGMAGGAGRGGWCCSGSWRGGGSSGSCYRCCQHDTELLGRDGGTTQLGT